MLKKEFPSVATPARTTSGLSCSADRRKIFSKLGYNTSSGNKAPILSSAGKADAKTSKSSVKSVLRTQLTPRKTSSHTRTTKKRSVKRKKKKKTKKRTNNGSDGLTREIDLSNELQAVVREPKMSRPAVAKAIWAYAKTENLVHPLDRRVIVCDQKLKDIFSNQDEVHMFEIQRLLLPHFLYSNEPIEKEVVSQEIASVKTTPKRGEIDRAPIKTSHKREEENVCVNESKDSKKHIEDSSNLSEGSLERFVMGENITLDQYPTNHADTQLKNESYIPYLYRQDPKLIEPTHTFTFENINKHSVTLSFNLEISNFLFTHIQHKNIKFLIKMSPIKPLTNSLGDSLYFPPIKSDPVENHTTKDIPIKIESNNTHRSTHFPYIVKGIIEFYQLLPNLTYDFTLQIARVSYGTPDKTLNLSVIELMPRENISLWSVEAVSLLMNSLKIPSFAKICQEYGINGRSLMTMRTQDFHALGLTVEFLVERIQQAVSKLN